MKTASGRLRLITLAAVSLLAAFYLIKTFKAGFGMSSALACQLSLLMLICTVLCLRPGWKFLKTFVPFTLWYALVPLVPLFCGVLVRSNEFMASACFGIFIFCGFFTVKELAGTIHAGGGRWYLLTFPLWIIALCLPLIFYGYGFLEGAVFSGDLILTILQTNLGEAYDYVSTAYGLKFLACVPFLFLIGLCGFWFSKPVCTQKFCVPVLFLPLITLLFVFLSALTLMSNKGFNSLERQIITFTKFVISDFAGFKQNSSQLLSGLKITGTGDQEPSLYVLVIGESECRDYMSAYGYPKPTTPVSDQQITDGSVLRFSRAYSNFTHTINSLSMALTSADQYRGTKIAQAVSLIQAARLAGFKTYWISNQSKDSMVDTPITAMAMQADKRIFISAAGGDAAENTDLYDGEILSNLPAMSENEKSLVIIHLHGSHFVYGDRYPESFAKFSDPNKTVGEYLNSILYTDHVLDELGQKFKADPRFMAMLYFSDHGADPTQKTDHNSSHFTFSMVRIPMLLTLSEKYRTGHAETEAVLSSHQDRCFTNDLIFDMMIGIMGIAIEGISDERFAITSEKYDLDREHALTLYGDRHVSDDPDYNGNPLVK